MRAVSISGAAGHDEADGGGAALDAELGEKVFAVLADGAFADAEGSPDLRAVFAHDQPVEHLAFPLGEMQQTGDAPGVQAFLFGGDDQTVNCGALDQAQDQLAQWQSATERVGFGLWGDAGEPGGDFGRHARPGRGRKVAGKPGGGLLAGPENGATVGAEGDDCGVGELLGRRRSRVGRGRGGGVLRSFGAGIDQAMGADVEDVAGLQDRGDKQARVVELDALGGVEAHQQIAAGGQPGDDAVLLGDAPARQADAAIHAAPEDGGAREAELFAGGIGEEGGHGEFYVCLKGGSWRGKSCELQK